MRQVIIRNNNGYAFGINNLKAVEVLNLRDKGVKSPMKIAGLVNLPTSYVTKILKVNRR